MIRKTIYTIDNFYFIYLNSSHNVHSKNDLPCKLGRYKYKLNYNWKITDMWHRNNDLPSFINTANLLINYHKYNIIYRYNGYANMNFANSIYIRNKCDTKFIKGICFKLLKDALL